MLSAKEKLYLFIVSGNNKRLREKYVRLSLDMACTIMVIRQLVKEAMTYYVQTISEEDFKAVSDRIHYDVEKGYNKWGD